MVLVNEACVYVITVRLHLNTNPETLDFKTGEFMYRSFFMTLYGQTKCFGITDSRGNIIELFCNCVASAAYEESHMVQCHSGFCLKNTPGGCCWLCLIRVSEVWRVGADTWEVTLSPAVTINQEHFFTLVVFIISSQTLAGIIRRCNCIC